MTEGRLRLPDVNVLVALTNPSHVHHLLAHDWLSSVERFATTPVTELGLVRLLLNPSIVGQQVSPVQATDILRALRADPRAVFLLDDCSPADPMVDTIGLTGHRQVTDFHLLDVARRADAILTTFDRRLARSLTAADAAHVSVLG